MKFIKLRDPLKKYQLKTSYGTWTVFVDRGKIIELRFPKNPPKAKKFYLLPPPPKDLNFIVDLFKSYFENRPLPVSVKLDFNHASEFQKKVWRQLCRIPFGQTKSYQQVAQQVGKPKASRAVGSACCANPLPLLVPCHRVIARDGSLGGFSAGLKWKKWLLKFEASRGKKNSSYAAK